MPDDEGKLKAKIDHVERAIERLNARVIASGAVLLAGSIGEIPLDHQPIWGALVTIGIAGEVILGVWHMILDHKLRDLRQQEGFAIETVLAMLRRETAAAEAHAVEAEAAIEQERLERMKIEERIAGRRLSSTQFDAIVSRLRPFGPPMNAVILLMSKPSPEQMEFARDIKRALEHAGWTAAWVTRSDATLLRGIRIDIGDKASDHERKAALELISALSANDVEVQSWPLGVVADPFTSDGEDEEKAMAGPIFVNIGMHPRGY